MSYFDRFDICEAHYALEIDYNQGGVLWERPTNRRNRRSTDVQLTRMRFKPGAGFRGFDSLSENGQEIYRELEIRYGFKKPERSPVEVLFRVSKGERAEVMAIISEPGKRTFDQRGEATCYAHTGQHSTCHVSWYSGNTRVAKPEEYAALKSELEAIGYEITVRRAQRTKERKS